MGGIAEKHNIAEEVAKSKPFYRKDLFVYGLIVILLGLALLPLFLTENGENIGFEVYIRGEKAFTYYYGGEKYAEDKFSDRTEFNAAERTLTIYFNDEKSEYNVLVADDAGKTVKVISSTCENHDCERMQNEIFCAPHFLKVTGIKKSKDVAVG